MITLSKRFEQSSDNMPIIDESRGLRSPDLHDDADSQGTKDSEDFGRKLA